MHSVRDEIQYFNDFLEKELKEIVEFSLELDRPDRDGYLYFSINQRITQLKLELKVSHRKEEFELCAALKNHINKLLIIVNTEKRPS